MASGFGSGTEDRQGPSSSSVKSNYASESRKTSQCPSVEADMAMEENAKRACGSRKVWETGFLAMDDLRKQGKLCDIVIKVGERSFPAHRVVLAAVCPYFRGMFAGELSESRQDVVVLKEVDAGAVEHVINFIYTGQIEVNEENVQQLLPTANLLQLEQVRDDCCSFLKRKLRPTNCLGFMAFADLYSCPELFSESQLYAKKHFSDVRTCEEFNALPLPGIVELISSNNLGVACETEVYEAVIQWVKCDLQARLQHLPELIEHVRFEFLSTEYVLKNVSSESLLNSHTQCKDFIIQALKYHLTPPTERNASSHRPVLSRARIGGPQYILIVGGQAPKAIKSTEVYDVKSHTSVLGPDLTIRRCRCGVAVMNGFVYAVGGFDGAARVSSAEKLDLEQERPVWTPVAPMVTRRCTLGVAVVNGSLYAVGGFDGTNGLESTERFDPETGQWTTVASMITRRSSVGVAVLNSCIYAVGGYDGISRQCLSSVERYDPSQDRWTLVEPMHQRRSGAAVAVMDNCLYAIGGHDGPDIRKSIECYDPRTNKWMGVPDMSTCRRNAAAIVVHNLLYVLGGDDGMSNLNTIEVYDSTHSTWLQARGTLLQGRSYAGVVVLDRTFQSASSSSSSA